MPTNTAFPTFNKAQLAPGPADQGSVIIKITWKNIGLSAIAACKNKNATNNGNA